MRESGTTVVWLPVSEALIENAFAPLDSRHPVMELTPLADMSLVVEG